MRTLKISFILLMLMASGVHAQGKDWIVSFDGWEIRDHVLIAKSSVSNIDLVTKESFKNIRIRRL